MLIFCDVSCVPINLIDDSVVLNLSSLYERVERLNIIPTLYNNDIFSVDFDLYYGEFIFNNNDVFKRYMKIIMPLYNGKNVIVLVTRSTNSDAVTESLIKIIQDRYGYISNNIFSKEDCDYLVEGKFSVFGIQALDYDKDRLMKLIELDSM